MSIKLSYPTAASHTAEVVLPDVEQLPASRPVRMRQRVIETDAGSLSVFGQGSTKTDVFELALYPLSKTNVDNIKAFFESESTSAGVNGRARAWQLTTSDSTVYNVRFQQDVLEAQQVTPSTWRVSLTLRGV